MIQWPTTEAPKPFTGLAVDHPDNVRIERIGDAVTLTVEKDGREMCLWISAPAKLHFAMGESL